MTEEGKDDPAYDASGYVRWICDPIDGTSNFITGETDWGLNVALEDNGAIRYAAIFLPVRGELLLADATTTYFLDIYGKTRDEISMAAARPWSTATSPYALPQKAIGDPLRRIRCYIHPGRRRNFELSAENPINRLYHAVANPGCTFSCVAGLAKVALGKLDAAAVGFQNYWDFAAARLILKNAGAHFAAFPCAENINGAWPAQSLTDKDFSRASAATPNGNEWQCHIIAAREKQVFAALKEFMDGISTPA